MEKIAELFLKIYPLEGVSVKRRILLHCVFWLMMFVGLWKVWTIPTSDLRYNFITVLYFVVLDMIYFYLLMYKIIPLWENDYQHKYLATIIGIIILIASIVIIFRIRVQFIFDNHLLKDSKTNLIHLEKKSKTIYIFLNILGFFLQPYLEFCLTPYLPSLSNSLIL